MPMVWRSKELEEHSCCDSPSSLKAANLSGTCSDQACADPRTTADPVGCPVCGARGVRVDLITLKALLNAGALRRLEGKLYRFCSTPDCDVVYFDNQVHSIFQTEDVTVRIGQKESVDPIPLCYCFDFTLGDIRRDIAELGRTQIPAIIKREVKAGHCACEFKNPQGICCLGNVTKAVEQVEREIGTSSALDTRR